MDLTSRDYIVSLILHVGFFVIIALMNPFKIKMHQDFESIAVNVISMPPLGNPELIKAEMPEIAIPQAMVDDDIAVPISEPESKTEKMVIEKPVEKPKPAEPKPKKEPKEKKETGYQSKVKTGDKSQKGGTDVSDQLGPGSKFGSATVDNANFNYPYYFIQTFGKIERNWSNPVASNQPISCVIYFQVMRTGTILESRIETSSGLEIYDRACLRALQASAPLPPLPDDFRDDIIGIHLEFIHKPR